MKMHRRDFSKYSAVSCALSVIPNSLGLAGNDSDFKLNYMLPSCMYGYEKLESILPESSKIGATAIDLWPKVHGDQREQVDAMGEEKFSQLLQKFDVRLGCITQYKLGPFGLKDEIKFANRFGCKTIVTGGKGPSGLAGTELKTAVKKFAAQMKPHLEWAAENKVTIAIENHGNNLIDSPDSLKWLVEFTDESLGIALAPYHLEQDPKLIAELIKSLRNRISVFYAWQHGKGCMKKLPKEQELLQMPGRGELDFEPILSALKSVDYSGWTEIFMHPFPRGIKILDTIDAVTTEINHSRDHLDTILKDLA